MLSKNQIKLITSLKQKKYRLQHHLFVAEGLKTIQEFLNSDFNLHYLFTTESFNINAINEVVISEAELKKISALKTPNTALAIFEIKEPKLIDDSRLIIALDNIRDPGNLGTIIRLCDWFGVRDLVCTEETVDCYNSKVIQATMGSLARVNISYIDLLEFLAKTKLKKFGAYMDGVSVYEKQLPSKGILILGNEASGISNKVGSFIDEKISIPRFGDLQKTESLNVAAATAILLSEFKRGVTET
ncbi:RNA methyltransferase [Yeosuana sp. MJ-SS3]|uniref:RNA methyltransferase n=1 Tax=Gilvirhabdus luticola TaxID=3079858 RepID=A0ABU3U491_9FLAO|nr:RNA methyltransferase [Yeosuana sp. MJ-SS3]MDU8885234.1 RNA methyltransferase [Yeosuana sp. MJ-SS3]